MFAYTQFVFFIHAISKCIYELDFTLFIYVFNDV